MLDGMEHSKSRTLSVGTGEECPRCTGPIVNRLSFAERYCLWCGYVEFLPLNLKPDWRSDIHRRLIYQGADPCLSGVEMEVVLKRVENFARSVVRRAICPLCASKQPWERYMVRRGKGQLYVCPDGHSVHLLECPDGDWGGWR